MYIAFVSVGNSSLVKGRHEYTLLFHLPEKNPVFGLFTVNIVTYSVAVFLVRTHFQNGFLCDFITLLQSCFSQLMLRI